MSELRDQLQKTLGGNYTLERELGGGGMSRVFVAEETSLARKVVVKVLPPDLAAAVNLERFRREIQLAAKLQHPHIVPVLAAGVSEGLPYYTMPFIEGETLRAKLSRSGEMPIHDAVRVLRDTLSALSYAHEHGVVHRDIKPDNILLTGGHAVVADFGVAKAISASTNPGSSLTSLGVALGTPAYMSPEQASADPATDHRSDIYSVGALAYEMLSGQQLFSSRSPQAMLAAQAMEEPEPLEKRRKSIPPQLSAVIMRSLEKHAADRQQSAAEMLAQLDAAVTPSSATTPYTGMMPARKVASSKRSTIMAVGAAAVLLLLGSSSWYWYAKRVPGSGGANGAAAADTMPSLAVLPFENLGKPDDAYFADGMTEEISSRLGTLSGLRVIGRQSVRGYANSTKPISQIGKELGVAYVLTGSVRWDRSDPAHSRVRVSPALLRVSDGTQVWSAPYEDELTGVFKMQSKVAEEVAQAMKLQLTRGEQQTLAAKPTDNVEAYDYFLRGKAIAISGGQGTGGGGDYLRSAIVFQKSVDLDPGFAEAWAQLAVSHLDAFWFRADPTPKRLALAKSALEKLQTLRPDAAVTHNTRGYYFYHAELNFQNALDEFAAALRIAPNDADALHFKAFVERRQGKWDAAIADMRRSVELDPRNYAFLGDMAEVMTYVRDYAAAIAYSRRQIAVDPLHFPGYTSLATAQQRSGDVNGALATLRSAAQQLPPVDFPRVLLFVPFPAVLDKSMVQAIRSAQPPANDNDRFLFQSQQAAAAVYVKDATRATVFADSMIALSPRLLTGSFSDADVHGSLATAYAIKGDRQRALLEAKKAVDMMPVSRDAVRGPANTVLLAFTAAQVGDADLAVSSLRQALAIPSTISIQQLKIDPWFNGIRNDPRFQALLAGH
ncbi:MAG: protein kinase [Gemmatimonadaceae bacterium]|nr:protein kinase [Gemmatimonadaceae bacterium]